jgi:hypothetical protein
VAGSQYNSHNAILEVMGQGGKEREILLTDMAVGFEPPSVKLQQRGNLTGSRELARSVRFILALCSY